MRNEGETPSRSPKGEKGDDGRCVMAEGSNEGWRMRDEGGGRKDISFKVQGN